MICKNIFKKKIDNLLSSTVALLNVIIFLIFGRKAQVGWICTDEFINIEEEEEIDQPKTCEIGEKKNQAGGGTAYSQFVLFKLRILSLLEIIPHLESSFLNIFPV